MDVNSTESLRRRHVNAFFILLDTDVFLNVWLSTMEINLIGF